MNQNEQTIIIKPNTSCNYSSLSFWDILLDETLITGTIYIPLYCQSQVGTLNSRLSAKQTYEYLLRLSQHFPIYMSAETPLELQSYLVLNIPEVISTEEGLLTDCYIVARYKDLLLKNQLFDAAVNSILATANDLNCSSHIILFLEDMLQESEQYTYLFQGSQPFLIYKGVDICYNILDVFAEALGEALQRKGHLVEYFDLSQEDFTAASRYIGKHFQAIIGIQSYMFSARLESGEFLHNKIYGHKYNFVFDHPVWFQQHLLETPRDLTILTLDRNYEAFIRRYYFVASHFLPPGGIPKQILHCERCYDVVFVGSYINNAKDISVQLKLLDRSSRFLVNRFWLNMRKHPELSAETALQLALAHYNRILSDEEFLELFHSMRKFVLYMSYHFRHKVITTLIENGIQIHVFGNTWADYPLREHPNLIWHEADLSTDECLDIWQQSKLSLNLMSWHKDAFTERIGNSLLQKTVVLTERNPYLEEHFKDGVDLIFYDLAHIDALPKRIRSLLSAPQQLASIAENGYQKAQQSHTWDCRANELLELNMSS